MDLHLAETMARSLMDEHGLEHLEFGFNNTRRAMGQAIFESIASYQGNRRVRVPGTSRATKIALSRVFTRASTEEEVRDTVLHEIAHALAGIDHGHDAVWSTLHRSIGGNGKPCGTVTNKHELPAAKWAGTCPVGHTITQHRAPLIVSSCSECSNSFSLANLQEWKKEGKVALMPARYTAAMSALKAKYPDEMIGYDYNGNRRSAEEVAELQQAMDEVFSQMDELEALPV